MITSPMGATGVHGARSPLVPSQASSTSSKFGLSLDASRVRSPAAALRSRWVMLSEESPGTCPLRGRRLLRAGTVPVCRQADCCSQGAALEFIALWYVDGSSSSQLLQQKCSWGKDLALAVGIVSHPAAQSPVQPEQERCRTWSSHCPASQPGSVPSIPLAALSGSLHVQQRGQNLRIFHPLLCCSYQLEG